jgi:hypothetical protein
MGGASKDGVCAVAGDKLLAAGDLGHFVLPHPGGRLLAAPVRETRDRGGAGRSARALLNRGRQGNGAQVAGRLGSPWYSSEPVVVPADICNLGVSRESAWWGRC